MLISGGDPLTLSDEQARWLLGRLRAIPHVEFVRIGTKVPVVLPQRITRELVRMLEALPPAVDEHPLHPPRRADAGGDGGLRAGWPTRAFRSAARPCCSRASTTTSR